MQLLVDGTTEQKFLLMLLERLQKLEGEVELLAANVRDRNDPWRHLHECDESEVAAHQIEEMLLNNRGSAEITYTGEVPTQAKRFFKAHEDGGVSATDGAQLAWLCQICGAEVGRHHTCV